MNLPNHNVKWCAIDVIDTRNTKQPKIASNKYKMLNGRMVGIFLPIKTEQLNCLPKINLIDDLIDQDDCFLTYLQLFEDSTQEA